MSQAQNIEKRGGGNVVYEITARVEPSIVAEFTKFMVETHVPDLLATGHFSSATIAANDGLVRISYIAISPDDLKTYLEDHAPRLRAEVVARFPTGVQIERNELQLLSVLTAPTAT